MKELPIVSGAPDKTKTYRINEIFYSIQGEGVRAGTANVFVRFSGCNLKCSKDDEYSGFDCDTEFTSGVNYTADELIKTIKAYNCPNVILTGGEPSLQAGEDLIGALYQADLFIAIETNGTKELPLIEMFGWICVSPKSAEHTLRVKSCHELKYVRHAGQGIPRPSINAQHHLISPAFNADGTMSVENLAHCIKLVKDNPAWRLSVQQHKLWRVR
jgi:7-carboxy-7-deazaguanine synthase